LVVVGGGNVLILHYSPTVDLQTEEETKYRFGGSITIMRELLNINDAVTACFSPAHNTIVLVGCNSGKVLREDRTDGIIEEEYIHQEEVKETNIIAVPKYMKNVNGESILADLKAADTAEQNKSKEEDEGKQKDEGRKEGQSTEEDKINEEVLDREKHQSASTRAQKPKPITSKPTTPMDTLKSTLVSTEIKKEVTQCICLLYYLYFCR
jgi:hypothetical protein